MTEEKKREPGISEQGEKIQIRAAQAEDAHALLQIYAPYVEHTAITFEYEVPSEAEFEDRIRNVLKRYPYLVAEQQGILLGYAYAGPFHARAAYDWSVETSIYVEQTRKRAGIGVRLYQAMEESLQEQGILNLNACIAYPEQEDTYLTRDSVKFHEKLGYQMAGHFHRCGYKFGKWYDMVWMEKLIGEHRENQLPVRCFDEVRAVLTQKYGIL